MRLIHLMKNILLTGLIFFLLCGSSYSQCVADYDFGDDVIGIAPDPYQGETFDPAILGESYVDVLHMLIPEFVLEVDPTLPFSPTTTLETLIPDFAGKWDNLQRIIDVSPEIVSHNLETVRRLTKAVRIQAKYDRSLELLFRLKKGGMKTKSGVMLGLGESEEEVIETMEDLRNVNVDILTLGQYLQPTPKHLPVSDFITPESFLKYKEMGLKMGFRYVESGPLVRSSYRAEKHLF